MQTKEEILDKIHGALVWKKPNEALAHLDEYVAQELADLTTANQTLLDEVNRLNRIIEKRGKVINALRDLE